LIGGVLCTPCAWSFTVVVNIYGILICAKKTKNLLIHNKVYVAKILRKNLWDLNFILILSFSQLLSFYSFLNVFLLPFQHHTHYYFFIPIKYFSHFSCFSYMYINFYYYKLELDRKWFSPKLNSDLIHTFFFSKWIWFMLLS